MASSCGGPWLSAHVSGVEHHPGGHGDPTIRVGIPYVDVDAAALRADGLNVNWGSVPEAFKAVIDNINGRKIVPYRMAVNPIGTAPAATACTELTEDDSVFAVITPLEVTCYLQHHTPVVASIYPAGRSTSVAQDFTPTPPDAAYDPLALSVFDKRGLFKHKTVALFDGGVGDDSELGLVHSALGKLHLRVVTTAVDTAPQGDEAAVNAQSYRSPNGSCPTGSTSCGGRHRGGGAARGYSAIQATFYAQSVGDERRRLQRRRWS